MARGLKGAAYRGIAAMPAKGRKVNWVHHTEITVSHSRGAVQHCHRNPIIYFSAIFQR